MKRTRILIADDDRQVRRVLRKRLEHWGHDVVEVSDGLGVIDHAVRDRVDAMILDHAMPQGDGRTVARMIRHECPAPIIFLSGQDEAAFHETLGGMDDVYYLPKPLESDRLNRLLQDCLQPNLAALAAS